MASELNVGGVNVSEPTGGTGLTVYRAGSGADIKIGADSTRYANYGYTYATDSATIGVDGASSLTIDSAGNVDIADGDLSVNGEATIERFASYRNLTLQRAQGTSASPTTIANGQTLGKLSFRGYTGSVYREGAAIAGKVSAGVSGDEIPSSLIFYTAADGATSATERLTISSTGLATFSSGIAFQSATSSTESDVTGSGYTLDKYETGSWTPVNSGSGSSSGTWDATLTGKYTRVGNLVTVNLKITGTTMDFSSTAGYRTYTGLPFTTSTPSGGACRTNHAAAFGATVSVSGTAITVIPVETGSGTNQADATATYFV
jgi:hypothetical protein